jgi:hypothetical protein
MSKPLTQGFFFFVFFAQRRVLKIISASANQVLLNNTVAFDTSKWLARETIELDTVTSWDDSKLYRQSQSSP